MKKIKDKLRSRFLILRKEKYHEINDKFLSPFFSFIEKNIKKKSIAISLYYPSNFEVNFIKYFFKKIKIKIKITSLLPVALDQNLMKFYKWNYKDPLRVNQYGMLEPFVSKKNYIPDIMLVPLLAYDEENFRLGYGKGYYDRYLNKYLNKNKNIITFGVAFSFQKYNKLPVSNYDVKLNYILTERGLI